MKQVFDNFISKYLCLSLIFRYKKNYQKKFNYWNTQTLLPIGVQRANYSTANYIYSQIHRGMDNHKSTKDDHSKCHNFIVLKYT